MNLTIESRGVAPYRVSSGGIPWLSRDESPDHFQSAPDFKSAFEIIFSLTDGGKSLHDEFIEDSTPQIVFRASDRKDVELLRQADKVGLLKVQFS